MTGAWVAVLLGVSAVLLLPRSRLPVPQPRGPGTRRRGPRARLSRFVPVRPDPLVQEVPLVIHQLTGLLAAGRAPHQLWADAAALQAASLQSEEPGPAGSTLSAQLLPVLEAAARAASLGLSPVPVFLAAAEVSAAEISGAEKIGRLPRNAAGTAGSPSDVLGSLWAELAACVRVSERSGAPLAGVLERYAGQLESALDNKAARDTALAGPQATVRLLTWLPVGGLGLGYLLGADPVGILLASPIGWLAAVAGIALSLIGRWWSTMLVRRAAGP